MAEAASLTPEMRQQIEAQFHQQRREIDELREKLAELDSEKRDMVIGVLNDADEARRCYLMNSGVLAERTVGDTLPRLKQTHDQVIVLMQTLSKQLSEKEAKQRKFMERFNIQLGPRRPM